ncbi:MAG: hypothetical protein V4534_00830 [Myxococcota bacterium]
MNKISALIIASCFFNLFFEPSLEAGRKKGPAIPLPSPIESDEEDADDSITLERLLRGQVTMLDVVEASNMAFLIADYERRRGRLSPEHTKGLQHLFGIENEILNERQEAERLRNPVAVREKQKVTKATKKPVKPAAANIASYNASEADLQDWDQYIRIFSNHLHQARSEYDIQQTIDLLQYFRDFHAHNEELSNRISQGDLQGDGLKEYLQSILPNVKPKAIHALHWDQHQPLIERMPAWLNLLRQVFELVPAKITLDDVGNWIGGGTGCVEKRFESLVNGFLQRKDHVAQTPNEIAAAYFENRPYLVDFLVQAYDVALKLRVPNMPSSASLFLRSYFTRLMRVNLGIDIGFMDMEHLLMEAATVTPMMGYDATPFKGLINEHSPATTTRADISIERSPAKVMDRSYSRGTPLTPAATNSPSKQVKKARPVYDLRGDCAFDALTAAAARAGIALRLSRSIFIDDVITEFQRILSIPQLLANDNEFLLRLTAILRARGFLQPGEQLTQHHLNQWSQWFGQQQGPAADNLDLMLLAQLYDINIQINVLQGPNVVPDVGGNFGPIDLNHDPLLNIVLLNENHFVAMADFHGGMLGPTPAGPAPAGRALFGLDTSF